MVLVRMMKGKKHAVEIAFRTHLLLTMHHCRYAGGSPSLKDDWYYVFNWPQYVLSYRGKGVDKLIGEPQCSNLDLGRVFREKR
jgi:hypothetical protein